MAAASKEEEQTRSRSRALDEDDLDDLHPVLHVSYSYFSYCRQRSSALSQPLLRRVGRAPPHTVETAALQSERGDDAGTVDVGARQISRSRQFTALCSGSASMGTQISVPWCPCLPHALVLVLSPRLLSS